MDEKHQRVSFKIVVKKVEKPFSDDPFDELEWICQSLGFFEPIDRDKTAAAVLKQLINSGGLERPLTSTQIAERVEMSRGAVINHLNNLSRAGLVVRSGRDYSIRSRSIYRTIEEIEEDIDRIFQKMKRVAMELDGEMGVKPKDAKE